MNEAEAAKILLNELDSYYLNVCLIPGPTTDQNNRMIRVAFENNALWYRNLCNKYRASPRKTPRSKPDTLIKRQHVRRILSLVANGIKTNSVYYERLRPYITECIEDNKVPF